METALPSIKSVESLRHSVLMAGAGQRWSFRDILSVLWLWFKRFLFWFVAGVAIGGAWKVAQGEVYTSRSDFAFYLGVTGGVLMIVLLGYPLRKHVKWMQRWGKLRFWFKVHMILGIVGPTCILFHSTFQARSPNAAVALACMLLVVLSGIIGRFVYAKIHQGLYGRRSTLKKVQEQFVGNAEFTKIWLDFAPQVKQWLEEFERQALDRAPSVAGNLWRFMTLGIRRWFLAKRCARALKDIFRRPEAEGILINEAEAIHLMKVYLSGVQQVAQFHRYERIFSLWHVLHIPLIYLLAASGIFHVISVYMY